MILGLTDAEGIAAPLPEDSNNLGCYFIQIYSTSKQIFYLPNGKVYHALHLTFTKLLNKLKAGEISVEEWNTMLRSLNAIIGNRNHDGARMEIRGNPQRQTLAFMGLSENLIRQSCYIIPVAEFWQVFLLSCNSILTFYLGSMKLLCSSPITFLCSKLCTAEQPSLILVLQHSSPRL